MSTAFRLEVLVAEEQLGPIMKFLLSNGTHLVACDLVGQDEKTQEPKPVKTTVARVRKRSPGAASTKANALALLQGLVGTYEIDETFQVTEVRKALETRGIGEWVFWPALKTLVEDGTLEYGGHRTGRYTRRK
jgi:hypothetical protein